MRAINPKEIIDSALRLGSINHLPDWLVDMAYANGWVKSDPEAPDEPTEPPELKGVRAYGLEWYWDNPNGVYYNAEKDWILHAESGRVFRRNYTTGRLEQIRVVYKRRGSAVPFAWGAVAGWVGSKIAEAIGKE